MPMHQCKLRKNPQFSQWTNIEGRVLVSARLILAETKPVHERGIR